MLNVNEALSLIKQQESETLEFKTNINNPKTAGNIISAFLNTSGGILIVGVDEDKGIIGVNDPKRIANIIQLAISRLTPIINDSITVYPFEINSKTVVIVEVTKGNDLYMFEGVALKRMGSHIRPITADVIASNFMQKNNDNVLHYNNNNNNTNNEIKSEIEKLAKVIENMNKEIIKSKSWKPQVLYMLLGAIIGAVFSTFAAMWFL